MIRANVRLLTLPLPRDHSVEPAGLGSYSSSSVRKTFVVNFLDSIDGEEETLIPPSLKDFSFTFQEDLEYITDVELQVEESKTAVQGSIFLALNSNILQYCWAPKGTSIWCSKAYIRPVDSRSHAKQTFISHLAVGWGSSQTPLFLSMHSDKGDLVFMLACLLHEGFGARC